MTSTPVNDASVVARGDLAGILRGPDAVIAAIPHLLGFHPQASIVIVWMQDRCICLTQRMDLASIDAAGGLAADAIGVIAKSAQATSAIAIIYGIDPHADRGWRQDIYEQLTSLMESVEVPLLDVLHVHQGLWWSYQCREDCCPASGRAIDAVVQQQVASMLADGGREVAASREAIVGALDVDAEALARVEPRVRAVQSSLDERLRAAEQPEEEREAWRDEQVAMLIRVVVGQVRLGAVDGDEADVAVAEALVGLSDIRVRDTVLWHLARTSDARACLASLIAALRAAPSGYVAPIATCTAIAAWLLGDGVRANAALERALGEDGAYALGWLVAQSIMHGLPPDTWRRVMSTLSEQECRTGPANARPDPLADVQG